MLSAVAIFGQTSMNGVYVQDGKTIEVDKKIHETTNAATLYFSNDLIVKVDTNSNFTVNTFFQDVLNTNTTPSKAQFGSHNLAASLMNGSAIVYFSGADSNSSCVISTPFTDLELNNGTFYFKIKENNVIVIVLDGSLKSFGDKKKENVVTAGYAVLAFPNGIGILEDKISLGSEKVKADTINKLNYEAKDTVAMKGKTLFALINGKIVGIQL